MSREDAEPDPGRNREPLDMAPVLPQEIVENIQQITSQALSFAHNLGRRPLGAQVVVHRPQTGHVMFFRREAPVDAETQSMSGQAALIVDERQDQTGVPDASLNGEQDRTLASILGLEADALQALLNVPEFSVHEWQRMRQAQRDRSARGRGR